MNVMSLQAKISEPGFPCSGAKTALASGQLEVFEARDLRCPADDRAILAALARFVEACDRGPEKQSFRSFAVCFAGPTDLDEAAFETALWERLEALHAIDKLQHPWSDEVSRDPEDPSFGFSLVGRAFYLVGLHPNASRKARRVDTPTIVFNLHSQFETLRASGAYERMQSLVRRRDTAYSGSINPMLADFGASSEARQYSGRVVDAAWRCPFHA
jgi:FPC/CPF motif-containing protein YcgG